MGIDWKNIVPCTSSSPNLFILKEVGVDEHVEVLGVAEGRYAKFMFGNLKSGSSFNDSRNAPQRLAPSIRRAAPSPLEESIAKVSKPLR